MNGTQGLEIDMKREEIETSCRIPSEDNQELHHWTVLAWEKNDEAWEKWTRATTENNREIQRQMLARDGLYNETEEISIQR